ncbi:DUF4381 domain-containing protein [soil metagenome]
MLGDGLVLRDIHAAVAPPWWPPAPGWWLLFAAVLMATALVVAWWAHRRWRRRRIARLFDDSLATAGSPPRQVAAMSELLRRAARRHDADADRLQGEAWLRFLDAGADPPRFAGETGQLLLDGGFRRDTDPQLDPDLLATLHAAARARFLQWMGARR